VSGTKQQDEKLERYRRRRDPRLTPEPFAAGPSGGASPAFVVQRHQARRLHYDLRLERDGVLASWAVPKGMPMQRGDRHLAVHVEDHPLEYATFEGEIPAGQYGAGAVEIWDSGTYELLEEKPDGGLTVRLDGGRLQGTWTLVPARLDGKQENWLLMRKDDGGRRASAYTPMLASSSATVPTGPGWVFEPKWDGFRALATVRGGETTLCSRNGNDLTARFPGVARAVSVGIRSADAVLDGEICALDERGRPSFSALQRDDGTLVFVAFDLLELDGEPLVGRALEDRTAPLDELVVEGGTTLQVSPRFDDGKALLAAAEAQGLEGIVAKRLGSRYFAGRRSADWVKVKLRPRQEVVVVGWTPGRGRRAGGFGALVTAVWDEGRLRFAGNVGTGFTDAEIERLLGLLRPLARDTCPLEEAPRLPGADAAAIRWVEPRLVVEVEFAEWTRDGRLRAPAYRGVREDRAASDIRRERAPVEPELRRGRRVLRLSNLEKPFWPDEGITKGDLLGYYRDVADVLVPHLRGRPFTMKRYPDGWQGKSFFQKDAPSHMPAWIDRAPFPASTRSGETRLIDYALLDDELALLWAVNMGCIEMHAWASRADRPDRPDWVMFDLDPSAGASFADAVAVAHLVREALELLELESYPKSSGSRGVHVLVPIARRHGYEETREFAGIVAAAIARAHPDLATVEWAKAKRRGVLIDANQNGPGRTTATVYSVRPLAAAPVSTPLRWDELTPELDPATFTMDAVLDRVARHGDLFAGVLAGRQSLKAALRAIR
jgi:bifunctional non-homologous end joining protein LigD